MRKVLLGLGLGLLFASSVSAQDISTTTCPGAGCVEISVVGQGSVGIQVSGTWVGTITFSASINGSTFSTLTVFPPNSTTGVTTTTSNGIWTANVGGLARVRVAFTAHSSGTATISRNTAQARGPVGAASSGPGSGTVTSVAATVPTGFAVSGSPVTTTGTLAISLSGTPTVDDTSGGNSCGASGNPSMVAGSVNLAWSFNVGAGGGTDCTITFSASAPSRWVCSVTNETTGNLVRASAGNATTIKVLGVLTAADVISGVCFAR